MKTCARCEKTFDIEYVANHVHGVSKRPSPFVTPTRQMNTSHGQAKDAFWGGRYTEHPFMRVYYGKGFRAVVTGMLDPLLLNELGYQPDPVWATGEGV